MTSGEDAAPLKQRLLEAALDELRDLDPEKLLHAIGARAIARRAGASSPGSINQHYGSLAGLAHAVVEEVYDVGHLGVPKINELLAQIKNSTLPLPVAFALHEAEFRRMTSDDEFKLRMGLWAFGGEQTRVVYRDYLRELNRQLSEAVAVLFAHWGREVRPPADLDTFLSMKIALVNGITLRHLTDPDDKWLPLFQRATMALELVMLRIPSDRHDLDGRLAEMNYYPTDRRARTTDERSRATEVRILRAANDLFSTHGLDRTGVEQISKHADVSLSTLKRYYPTKAAIAVALLLDRVVDALSHLGDPGDLVATLGAIATQARTRPDLAAAYVAHLADPVVVHEDDPLVTATRRCLRDDEDHDDAEVLVLLTVRRALTHPTAEARQIVASVLRRRP